jgi:hypothetical protein
MRAIADWRYPVLLSALRPRLLFLGRSGQRVTAL